MLCLPRGKDVWIDRWIRRHIWSLWRLNGYKEIQIVSKKAKIQGQGLWLVGRKRKREIRSNGTFTIAHLQGGYKITRFSLLQWNSTVKVRDRDFCRFLRRQRYRRRSLYSTIGMFSVKQNSRYRMIPTHIWFWLDVAQRRVVVIMYRYQYK